MGCKEGVTKVEVTRIKKVWTIFGHFGPKSMGWTNCFVLFCFFILFVWVF